MSQTVIFLLMPDLALLSLRSNECRCPNRLNVTDTWRHQPGTMSLVSLS
jgi:hypothetical protein